MLGKNVRRLREEKGVTQAQLAEFAGIHARYVQDIEACRRNPTVAVVRQLKSALGCKWEDLLDKPVR